MKTAIVNSYLLGLIHKKGIKNQFIFKPKELHQKGFTDPLSESSYENLPGLFHRYPDRVVITVTNRCFAYCRFCFRKRIWSNFEEIDMVRVLDYLKNNTGVHEVIISGGDPFIFTDSELNNILSPIKSIKHIYNIRISSRVLSVNPERIGHKTVEMLKRFKPVWFVMHINHPDEITREFEEKARLILAGGIPMVSQTVLLRGINDDHNTLKKLFCKLVQLGIKPYYLFGCDQATGNKKFRVSIDRSLAILSKLKGQTSGLCIPMFSFDLPGGGGKITLEPNHIVNKNKNIFIFKNFEGREFFYEDI